MSIGRNNFMQSFICIKKPDKECEKERWIYVYIIHNPLLERPCRDTPSVPLWSRAALTAMPVFWCLLAF